MFEIARLIRKNSQVIAELTCRSAGASHTRYARRSRTCCRNSSIMGMVRQATWRRHSSPDVASQLYSSRSSWGRRTDHALERAAKHGWLADRARDRWGNAMAADTHSQRSTVSTDLDAFAALGCYSAITGLRSTPIPETSTSTVSPGFMNSGGLRFSPTPPGVPVRMTSPGISGRIVEQ